MNNHPEVNDLQLEDVEDYSSDYPPSSGFPQSDNIAAVGMAPEGVVHKKRANTFIALMRANKWTAGALGLVIVVLIVIIAIAGGGSKKQENLSTTTHQKPFVVDPKDVDPEVKDALLERLISVYTRKGLDTTVLTAGTNGPQLKALHWLAVDKNLSTLDHTQFTQRYTLAVFYYATNAVSNPYNEKPRPWVSAHLWLSDVHVCEWNGIVCNEQDHVVDIDLERNNLSGSLPIELGIIGSTLKTLDVTSNQVYMGTDDMDVFQHLVELESLLADDNFFLYDEGLPWQFKRMEKLKKMRLSYNLFSGELETTHEIMTSLGQLTHLEIESNFLSGSLPSILGTMSNLVYIYLRRNELKFNLDFLKGGQMTDLFALWLDSNDVTGTIPTEIGLLTELASVSITNATLTGKIPTEMANLVNLRRLWLYNNELTGSIPSGLTQLTELEVFEVHGNKLGGVMPQGVCSVIENSPYEFKSLTSDCVSEVTCDMSCCTKCY